jgi:K+-sensing histidine kinase KdpD
MKFSQAGSTIHVQFSHSGNLLRLSIEDQGSGIGEGIIRSVFHRYLRQPNIEDSRHGLGLGMVLVRNTAMDHGGTVLIDQPEGTGTRVTLTLAIRQENARLRQNILRPVAGGYNPQLIELSQVLPPELYKGNQ